MANRNPITRAELRRRYGHWTYVLILPLYLTAFFLTEHFINGSAPYIASYLPVDDAIPFCEWFYIAYVLWFPMLGVTGLHLAFTDPGGLKRYMTYIGISFCTAIVLFWIFPNGQDLRPDIASLGRENFCTRAIATLYTTDTNTNVCPSIHVVGCFAAFFASLHNKPLIRLRIPVVMAVLLVLISASTVFIKQHSLFDVLVAVPYSLIFYPVAYRWLPRLLHRLRRRQREIVTAK